jgi:IclR family pca regulon transcriptional regulator
MEREPSPAENPKNVVNSVTKVFAVLKAFDASQFELTMSQIATRSELDRGTAFRLVHTLASLGYIRAVPDSRRFRLTLKCLELGFSALSAQDLPVHTLPLLREAVPLIADAGSLGVLEAGEIVYVERLQGGLSRHTVDRRPGTRIGAYATALGHAILAYLPRHEQIAHLESTDRVKLSETTLTDLDALLSRLQDVRLRGYAVSNGENAYGLRTVAAPILDPRGNPVAAIGLTIQASRSTIEEFVAKAVPELQRMATELSAGLLHSRGAIGITGTDGRGR